MIGPSGERWRIGLEVMADTPPPGSSASPHFAFAIEDDARSLIQRDSTMTLHDRALGYGELLVRCAACHDAVKIAGAGRTPR
jgi:hypothetical protein